MLQTIGLNGGARITIDITSTADGRQLVKCSAWFGDGTCIGGISMEIGPDGSPVQVESIYSESVTAGYREAVTDASGETYGEMKVEAVSPSKGIDPGSIRTVTHSRGHSTGHGTSTTKVDLDE